MWAIIAKIFNLIFGIDRQADTNQSLGKVEQQRDDATEANKEDERAQQIDQDVGHLSDDELNARLRRPTTDPGRPQ